jgi:diacylglycerol kinase (ATP)
VDHSFDRPHFVVNARSRPSGAPGSLEALRALVLGVFPGARWMLTSGPGDAVALARGAAADGADVVIAVGGDGTVNEVANGLLTAPVAPPTLGILPAGSGSDFVRSLGIPRHAAAALRVLADGRRRRIDVGRIVCAPLAAGASPGPITRFFVNIAGCGASAQVTERFNRRRIRGSLGYATAAALTAFTCRWPQVEIRADDAEPKTITLTMLFVCNGEYCGGGMRVGRGARLDDGSFHVVEAAGISRLRTILEWPRLYRGRLEHVAGVRVTPGRRLDLSSRDDVLVDCDGEVCGRLPATYAIVPGALDVCAPAPVDPRCQES